MDTAKMPMPEPDEPSAFEKFEDLARRLVRIPKAEIDAKRQQRNDTRGSSTT